MNLEQIKQNMQSSIDFLNGELRKLRAGRANPDMVKGIKVTAYNTLMPIEQLANINVVDPTLITIQPWDKTVVNDLAKAIQTSDLGINPMVEADLIRLPLPPMTSERRQEYVKVLKQKTEDAKISIRQKRREYMEELDKKMKNEKLPEEEKDREEKNLQSIVDQMNKLIDEISQKKEQELLTV